jgi:hypothetical protein
MTDSSTAIFMKTSGDTLEFRISKDGHIDVAAKIIAAVIGATPKVMLNSIISFDTGPPGRRTLLE